jgi:pyridoxine/pyridoxamine 5'-phosphate oxidase
MTMTRAELLPFLQKHRLGVQSTVSPDGAPQAAVVGIAITSELEIIFDTLETTRKCRNLRSDPRIAFVIGWDQEITVQLEGIADEPAGAERDRILDAYFAVYPECRDHLTWTGITHFRVRPSWIRYSDFNAPQQILEFT